MKTRTNNTTPTKEKIKEEAQKKVPRIRVLSIPYSNNISDSVQILQDAERNPNNSEANATSIGDNNGGRITLNVDHQNNKKK